MPYLILMKFKFLIPVLLLFTANCTAQSPSSQKIKTGIEILAEDNYRILEGKKVGLITNATGVNSALESTVDLLHRAENVNLVALFGPEHGIRGEFAAGAKIDSYVDEITGIQVHSLYGTTRKPTPEMLKGVDVLVYDIQDIGVRSYTYISTMGLAMEAAAELGMEFVVLDRPNPLGGEKIEGNITEEGFISFVSPFPIPYIYGLTSGELAQMINDEGWLNGGLKVALTVIKMKGWERDMTFGQTGLPWVPTSPHIPHNYSPYYYVATGIMGELGVISEGVGYTLPFQVFGAENINELEITNAMKALNLPGIQFRPVVFKPFYGRDEGKTLHGTQIHFTDYDAAELMTIQYYFLQEYHKLNPNHDIFSEAENRWIMFDKVNGSDEIRKRFSKNYKVEDILSYLNKDIKSFSQKSSRYYLY